ncbi:hypothetical protein OGAPHI_002044 [Ogataea philodendri]|uniref:CAF1B/HIR1 beta-propeller domain-containing protein n=1 Tax=Ogataea philodendri TaxID=1378263 RepID=A0A9P8PB24_9ASCO|nr:uncharacterized protein OGAPHI_002044 [Ogataea philodendri]KAH3668290.1 hypothetical protein OGAPHI_002044 [Ogataea philodendri]
MSLEASIHTLHWHDNNLPVYSLDIQPSKVTSAQKTVRVATGGGDNNVRIWRASYTETGVESIQYLSSLTKHTQAVNCVRFDPSGELLASASDDGTIMIWSLSDKIIKEFGNEEDDVKESWYLKTSCRSSSLSEVYDISWSPDSKYICCGSMDNITRIFNVSTGTMIKQIAEHNHYVQGVTWDPRNEFICSQSADRSVHIYKILSDKASDLVLSPTTFYKIVRAELPTKSLTSENLSKNLDVSSMDPPLQTPRHKRTHSNSSTSSSHSLAMSITRSSSPLPAVMPASSNAIYKNFHLYHNETLQSFFRRLSFSPDGMLLLTTSGIYKTDGTEENVNTVYIHTRVGLNRLPVAHLPGFKKPAIAIKFSPVLYKLIPDEPRVFKLDYRMIFAVATQDSLVLYDTQRLKALGIVTNIHYAVITDLSWSPDGQLLMVSSADGFVSSVNVSKTLSGEIEAYNGKEFLKKKRESLASTPATPGTPALASVPQQTSIIDMLQMEPIPPPEIIGKPGDSVEVIDITTPRASSPGPGPSPKRQKN